AGALRRLNRREYHNTIRDLLGLDFDATALFPADGTGGAGFDTNGDTLYIQPLMMERYLQAAQQILDRVVVTPRLSLTLNGHTAALWIYVDGDSDVGVAADASAKMSLKVDGGDAGVFAPQRGGRGGRGAPPMVGVQVHLDRGTHVLALSGEVPAGISSIAVEERRTEPTSEKRAMHYRLLGSEPGDQLLQPRKSAREVMAAFLPRAFRRPVQPAEIDRFLAM